MSVNSVPITTTSPKGSALACHTGHLPLSCDIYISSAVSAITKAVGRAEWSSIHEIKIPLSQRLPLLTCPFPCACLSHAIDEASYSALLASTPEDHSKALALPSAIRHAGDCLNVVSSSSLHILDHEFCWHEGLLEGQTGTFEIRSLD